MSNLSLIALGINAVREGDAITQGGIATIAEGICTSWNTSVRWSYGQGDGEVSGVCTMRDMFKGHRHADGSADTRFLPAVYVAIADAFGVDGGFATADKVAFHRAFGIAAAKMSGAVPVEFVTATAKVKGKSVKVKATSVPASVAFKLTEEDGKPSKLGQELVERLKANVELSGEVAPEDDVLLERAKSLPVNCVGGTHPVFGKVPSSTDVAKLLRGAAVDAGYMPAPKQRETKQTDKGSAFVAALDMVTASLDMLLSSDESDFAPCDTIDAKLRTVAERIAAYFSQA